MFISGSTLMRGLIIVSFASLFLLSSAYAYGGIEGKKLHTQNCVKCHGDSVYKRTNRRMKNYKSLETQVRRCNVPAAANFDNDQITAVTDYLNNRYYKFDPLK